jgi:serine/threonine protein kinase
MLKTDKETYYCGNRDEDENAPLNVLARTFYNIFKMVYMPYNANNRLKVKKFMFSVPRYEENSLQDKYVLNPSQLLGSGQFGQVYAGIRKEDNTPVAIKVIEKSRFKDFRFENNVFQNEITILYNIEHPGILKLLSLFDQTDHVKI